MSVKHEFERVVIMRCIRLRLVKYPSSAVEILPKGGSKRLKSFHKQSPATNHRYSAIKLLDRFYHLPTLSDVLCNSQANARAYPPSTELASSITIKPESFLFNTYSGDGALIWPQSILLAFSSLRGVMWNFDISAYLRKTHKWWKADS